MVTEEPDKFKEVMEEIFDIKIELIQAFSDLGKKFDNLINARAFFQSEQPPTLIGIPDVPVKKESTKNVKVTSNALITGKIGILTEKAVQISVGDQFAWIPKKAVKNLNRIVLNQGGDAKLEIVDWFIEKVEWKSNE